MKLEKRGKNTSKVEVHTSPFGVWLFVYDTEYFLPYDKYPWFLKAKISDIYNVKLQHKSHLYWEKLDVDLDLDCLSNPQKYPLLYR